MTITHMDLSINTSSAAVPYVGGSAQVQVARINARDLYRMTLENCASFERFPKTNLSINASLSPLKPAETETHNMPSGTENR